MHREYGSENDNNKILLDFIYQPHIRMYVNTPTQLGMHQQQCDTTNIKELVYN